MNNDDLHQNKQCIRRAADIVGNKWTALIVRCLTDGPKRFSELQREINLNPRTLSQRLDALTCGEIIEPVNTANNAYRSYRLTRKGQDLLPILQKMAEWGDKYPCPPSSTIA